MSTSGNYSKDPAKMASSDRLQNTQKQVDEVVDIMKTNVERIMEREEKLQTLDERANNLSLSANEFQTTSGKLKRKMWWKNLKMMLILGGIVVVLIVIIVLATVPMGGSSSGGGGGGSGTTTTTVAPAPVAFKDPPPAADTSSVVTSADIPDVDAGDRAKRSLPQEPQQMNNLLLNLIAN